MAWSVSVFPFPSQRPWSSYYRTPSASLHKHRLPALLFLSTLLLIFCLNHAHRNVSFSSFCAFCESDLIITTNSLIKSQHQTAKHRVSISISTPPMTVDEKKQGLFLPGHCAGAELGVMCSSMLSVRSRFLSLSSRPWYTMPVNWLASVWLLQSQQKRSKWL